MPFSTLEEFSQQSLIKPLVRKDTAAHSYIKVTKLMFRKCDIIVASRADSFQIGARVHEQNSLACEASEHLFKLQHP